ncbi:UPF0058 family protein [Methanobacterium sp. ACI-7]|uniref:UPF0058 family protein n=1 Tax=unclassified Methanobacterium TaxID=2627676 RepID=UPI0039C2ED1D
MYKDELIQLHQFLVYVLKYLEDGYEVKGECEEYFLLNISPHHIHRTKAEHKYAIFVLSESISELIARKNDGTAPPNVSNGLAELAKRSKKEIMRMHEDNALKYEKNKNVEII